MIKINRKNISLVLLVIILVLNLVFVLISVERQMHEGDEVALIECARSVTNTGIPAYNHGQLRPNSECLWHPPGYIYILSAFIFAFGENNLSTRAPAIISSLIATILIYIITLNLLKKNKFKYTWAIIAAALYALNPLTIQSTIILDMDCIQTFLLVLFVYLYTSKKANVYLLIPLILLFWTKFPGVIILFGSLFIFTLIKRDWKELRRCIILFVIAGIFFLVTFFAYTYFTNQNFLMPFHNSSIIISLSRIFGSLRTALSRSLWSLKTFVYFITPFFILLFVYSLIKNIKSKSNDLLMGIIPLIAITFFGILGSTAWNFPKYYIATIPFMAIFISSALSKEFKEFKFLKNKFLLLVLLTSILIIVNLVVLAKDPLIPEIYGTSRLVSFNEAVKSIIPNFLAYILMPIILSVFLIYVSPKNKKIFILLFCLTILLYLYIGVIQASADYSTFNLYGTHGLKQIIDFIIQNNINPGSIASYSQVGYYTNFSEFLDIMDVYNSPEEFKNKVIDNSRIEYLIIFDKDVKRLGDENLEDFVFLKKIGDYNIYHRKL